MFKRVARRIKKKEEEEALGLDEDMKEVLGMHDTDSDESDSESGSESNLDSPSSSEEEEGDVSVPPTRKRKRGAVGSDGSHLEEGNDTDVAQSDDEEVGSDEEEGGDDDSEVEAEDAPMSLGEALRNPIFVVSLQPEEKACVVCPGKLLKNAKMAHVHLTSNAHKRRFTKFSSLAKESSDGTVLDILEHLNEDRPQGPISATEDGATSKRAAKRKAKIEAVKKKRDRQKITKAKALAKKAKAAADAGNASSSTEDEDPSAKPAQKKRKSNNLTTNTVIHQSLLSRANKKSKISAPSQDSDAATTLLTSKGSSKPPKNVKAERPASSTPITKPSAKHRGSVDGNSPAPTAGALQPEVKVSKRSVVDPKPAKAKSGGVKSTARAGGSKRTAPKVKAS